MTYHWKLKDWPHFTYELSGLEEKLLLCAQYLGRYEGRLSSLSKELHLESVLEIMVVEAVKTSEIEGEYISRTDIRSSL
tara:strand:- start:1469 stop:1705 length:237 start_codon:yes stop_codon:yes gene_type:complete